MSKGKHTEAETVTAIKATGRGGKYNFPSTVEPEDPDAVREAMGSVLYWLNRGKDDKPETDEQVEARVMEYLNTCYETGQRATVEKLALALGITRKVLYDWESGRSFAGRRSDIIKKAKEAMAAYDADMVSSGKLNPVPYIFRAKNYYGMKDQQDVVLTPNSPLQTDTNPIDIANKYNALPED